MGYVSSLEGFLFFGKLFFESIVEECELFFNVPLSEVKHIRVGADFIVEILELQINILVE